MLSAFLPKTTLLTKIYIFLCFYTNRVLISANGHYTSVKQNLHFCIIFHALLYFGSKAFIYRLFVCVYVKPLVFLYNVGFLCFLLPIFSLDEYNIPAWHLLMVINAHRVSSYPFLIHTTTVRYHEKHRRQGEMFIQNSTTSQLRRIILIGR